MKKFIGLLLFMLAINANADGNVVVDRWGKYHIDSEAHSKFDVRYSCATVNNTTSTPWAFKACNDNCDISSINITPEAQKHPKAWQKVLKNCRNGKKDTGVRLSDLYEDTMYYEDFVLENNTIDVVKSASLLTIMTLFLCLPIIWISLVYLLSMTILKEWDSQDGGEAIGFMGLVLGMCGVVTTLPWILDFYERASKIELIIGSIISVIYLAPIVILLIVTIASYLFSLFTNRSLNRQ